MSGPASPLPNETPVETQGKPRARKRGAARFILPGLIILSLAVTAFALLRPGGPKATPVGVVAAKTGTLVKTVSGTGSAKAEVSRTVSFTNVGANVAEVLVRVGDEVRDGQTLARLDTAPAGRDLDAAQAAQQSAQADLARAEASANEAQLDLTRQVGTAQSALRAAQSALTEAERTLGVQRGLLSIGGISQQDVRTAELAREDAARRVAGAQADLNYARSRGTEGGQAGISSARSALEAARVRVRNAQSTLTDAALRSPTAGVISAVNISAGNPAPNTQPAIEITDPSRLYLEVPFDETRAPELSVGQSARVQFDALPNDLSGTVGRVEPVARSSGQAASVLVRITLDDPAGVKPGFTGTATVTTRKLRDAVMLPLETTSETGGKVQVWRVTPGEAKGAGRTGTAQPVTVTETDRNVNFAAVKGVKGGDLIVTPFPGELKAGDPVSYTAPAADEAGKDSGSEGTSSEGTSSEGTSSEGTSSEGTAP